LVQSYPMAGSSVARSSLYATIISPPFCGVEFDDEACVGSGAVLGLQAVRIIATARNAYKSVFRLMIFFSFGKSEYNKPQLNFTIAVNVTYLKHL
jgi:hypothetical protein